MNRYLLAAVLAVAGALATADTASAQYPYQYGYNNYYAPFGGAYYGTRNYASPYSGYSALRTVTPYGGLNQQNYYSDAFGNQAARYSGYNPLTHMGYTRGYTASPFGGYYPYSYLYRR